MATAAPPDHPVAPSQAADLADVGSALASILLRLDRLAQLLDETPTHIAFGGAGMQQRIPNWPVAGHDRLVVATRSRGATLAIAAGAVATAVDLLGPDPGRGGLSISNYGANPVLVYLGRAGDAQTGGLATVAVSAGASWDGRIGGELWCGAVSASSPLGTSVAIATI